MWNSILGVVRRVIVRPYVWAPAIFLAFAAFGMALGSWRNLCASCPSIAQIYDYEPTQTSKVYAQNGELIAEFGEESRSPVSIAELPEHVPQAFVAIEDKRFYRHRGLDPRGIARAVYGVLTGRSTEMGGGSTITQQLARNMFKGIGFERRLVRKLKEAQVALQLERVYTKDQILEGYINQINYGQNWLGIQTAARNYFGKDASQLTPVEAAMLAAIPNRPERYSPLNDPEATIARRNLVLERMADQGYLTEAEAKEFKGYPVPTARASLNKGVAPYFVEWVRGQLDDRFGEQLYTAGLNVYTTLNVDMQRAANLAMEHGFSAIEARPGFEHARYALFADSSGLGTGDSPYVQGAFVALDPLNGHVRAMVGGRDFRHSKFNRATQARRQAGSGFKPFVYTAAIASGVPASYVLIDSPVVLPQPDSTEWKPQNFTPEFKGPMTLREGLRSSTNMIAIKLGMEIGLETVAQTARRMGIRTEVERFESTAIGAAEVIPIQMAEAYSAFATLGVKASPFGIERVESADGEVLWSLEPENTRVLEPPVARIMVSILEDVVNRGTATSIRTVAGLPYEVPVAGKTGTTNNSTDTWFLGFTPNLLAVAWFGMDLPREVRPNATGGGDAAPVWGEFARLVYFGTADEDSDPSFEPMLPVPEAWPIVDGLTTRVVDKVTGRLASEWCPEEDRYTELFLPGTEPTELCDRSGIDLLRRLRVPG
jgi:1A family penicillin-binding protein